MKHRKAAISRSLHKPYNKLSVVSISNAVQMKQLADYNYC